MQQSIFYEEEPIVPLHKKLKHKIVYLFYRFRYNMHVAGKQLLKVLKFFAMNSIILSTSLAVMKAFHAWYSGDLSRTLVPECLQLKRMMPSWTAFFALPIVTSYELYACPVLESIHALHAIARNLSGALQNLIHMLYSLVFIP